MKRSADGGKERPSFTKRDAYLFSDQTHRRDERREGRGERRTVKQARPCREMLDCKTRPQLLDRRPHKRRVGVRFMKERTSVVAQQMVRASIDELTSRGHESPYDQSALEVIAVEVFEAKEEVRQSQQHEATENERTDQSARGRP